ncbi:glycoside hydrolase family 5 protein [Tortispora caseinolytica NRRL Y-17796]|uniref:Glycoside hydrolase family 5 protein n=1 Tax=Tortispora caseinolytica NRRL Y-17796 TaxID=767744 RepID=A0A1E4TJT6_9ASCO|nr:glycoside hydrolase family 5 protein [Tortispora caseinolytica NRRL Y-17796]
MASSFTGVGGEFVGVDGRVVYFRGINVAGECKLPAKPFIPSYELDHFFDGDNVSFVGRPFSLDSAPAHFAKLKSLGFNLIRYVFTWEALEHQGPGIYDTDFIKFTIDTLQIIRDTGLHVVMDPHQDVWSRFTGGSGAPMWTVYAAGLDPHAFSFNESAIVHNTSPDPSQFMSMIWATNYGRAANLTINTMFFGGRDFAPKCKINGQNIQDFLESHFINAVVRLAQAIKDADPSLYDTCVIGFESINEPNPGLIGCSDLKSRSRKGPNLLRGTSPTVIEAFQLAQGRTLEIDTYDLGRLGFYKTGSQTVNESGRSSWLDAAENATFDEIDAHYGWSRDASWPRGKCPWAAHGIWDLATGHIKKPDYFGYAPDGKVITENTWVEYYWTDHLKKYIKAIRTVSDDLFVFCQPPVMTKPPNVRDLGISDSKLVYAPHYYDGMTLMHKTWNTFYNVDVLGIMRGRYLTPALAMVFGERNIRRCLRDQLREMRKEGYEAFGPDTPAVLTEYGVPFDMNNKEAFETGDYSQQLGALDASQSAVEGANFCHCLWNYTPSNSNLWGDDWNLEDFSIFSRGNTDTESLRSSLVPYKDDGWSSGSSSFGSGVPDTRGIRVLEGVVRASPVYVQGEVMSFENDIHKQRMQLEIAANAEGVTELFVPRSIFPLPDVDVTAGSTSINGQSIYWTHPKGEHRLTLSNGEGNPYISEACDPGCVIS